MATTQFTQQDLDALTRHLSDNSVASEMANPLKKFAEYQALQNAPQPEQETIQDTVDRALGKNREIGQNSIFKMLPSAQEPAPGAVSPMSVDDIAADNAATPTAVDVPAPSPEPASAPAAQETEKSAPSEEPQASSAGTSILSALSANANPLANNQALVDAQKKQSELQMLANLNRSGAQIAQGLTRTEKPLDTSVADSIERESKQPVGNYLQQVEFQKQDPNSAVSKQLKNFFEDTFKMKLPDGISAADIEKVIPNATKLIETKQQKQMMFDFKASENQKNRDLKQDLAETAGSNKATAAQSKAKQEAMTFLESSRTTPDVRQALLDRYSASKAELLLKKKDLNSLSSNEVQLLASELGKIATGGVPTSEELKALTPNTLMGVLSKEYSKVINKPTPANAGAFLQRYKDYLGDLKKNANSVISNKVGRVIEAKKRELGPDAYNDLQETYKDMLNPDAVDEQQSKNADNDAEAVAWAQKNSKDPRAQQILQLHGIK